MKHLQRLHSHGFPPSVQMCNTKNLQMRKFFSRIKSLATPTNAQLHNLCTLSITYLLHVSALSPSSGGLHKTKKKNRKRT